MPVRMKAPALQQVGHPGARRSIAIFDANEQTDPATLPPKPTPAELKALREKALASDMANATPRASKFTVPVDAQLLEAQMRLEALKVRRRELVEAVEKATSAEAQARAHARTVSAACALGDKPEIEARAARAEAEESTLELERAREDLACIEIAIPAQAERVSLASAGSRDRVVALARAAQKASIKKLLVLLDTLYEIERELRDAHVAARQSGADILDVFNLGFTFPGDPSTVNSRAWIFRDNLLRNHFEVEGPDV